MISSEAGEEKLMRERLQRKVLEAAVTKQMPSRLL